MREIITRYGREGLGFLWLIGEPLIFCLGVILLWSVIKPEYEHGIKIGPFTMTGYMCLLLMRHLISSLLNGIQANTGLLYHRHVKPFHIYFSRITLEISGTTVAFIIVYTILFFLGQVGLPKNILLLYFGWLILAWFSSGLALTMAGIALRYDVFERLAQVLTYLLIPMSGAFFMVSFIPPPYRDYFLLIPIPHTVEMVRAGVFGEFVKTYYQAWYPLIWGLGLNLLGLALISGARDRIDVE